MEHAREAVGDSRACGNVVLRDEETPLEAKSSSPRTPDEPCGIMQNPPVVRIDFRVAFIHASIALAWRVRSASAAAVLMGWSWRPDSAADSFTSSGVYST